MEVTFDKELELVYKKGQDLNIKFTPKKLKKTLVRISKEFMDSYPNLNLLSDAFHGKDTDLEMSVCNYLKGTLINLGTFAFRAFQTEYPLTATELQDTYTNSCSIYAKKNHDYGDSFTQTLDLYTVYTVFIRLFDKVQRLVSLSNIDSQVKDESTKDTYIDLLNYIAMGLLYVDKHLKELNAHEG